MVVWLSLSIVILSLALLYVIYQLIKSRRRADQLYLDLRRTETRQTSRRAIQERELAWHRAVFDQIPVAVVVTDAHKSVIAINDAAKELFGASVSGERAIVRLRHHALDELLDTAWTDGTSGEIQVELDDRIVHGHASRWYYDGEPAGVVLVLLDVSERVYLARARRDLAANLGHELRTPLTSMRIMVETLQDGALEERALARQLLDRMTKETEAMIRLVEDLTTLTLLENGREPLRLERQPLVELIDHVIERMQPLITRKKITIEQDVKQDLIATLDRERFGRVLTNLLDNAIKFTPDGGTITVRACHTGETIRLAVEDSGPGIPPGVLPRVFERFYKYDKARTRSKKAGTGIGLAVVKHLVTAHGGRVWAESPPGRGARFVIELPADVASSNI